MVERLLESSGRVFCLSFRLRGLRSDDRFLDGFVHEAYTEFHSKRRGADVAFSRIGFCLLIRAPFLWYMLIVLWKVEFMSIYVLHFFSLMFDIVNLWLYLQTTNYITCTSKLCGVSVQMLFAQRASATLLVELWCNWSTTNINLFAKSASVSFGCWGALKASKMLLEL